MRKINSQNGLISTTHKTINFTQRNVLVKGESIITWVNVEWKKEKKIEGPLASVVSCRDARSCVSTRNY
jgi:hypothetical protein